MVAPCGLMRENSKRSLLNSEKTPPARSVHRATDLVISKRDLCDARSSEHLGLSPMIHPSRLT